VTFSGNPNYAMDATASSGLDVSYSVGPTDPRTVSGDVVTLTGAGTCNVTASQSGDGDYQAATPVTQQLTINPGAPSVTVTPNASPAPLGEVSYTVSVSGVAGTTPTGSVSVSDGSNTCAIDALSDGSGQCSINEAAGGYTVTATYSGDDNYSETTGSTSEQVDKATPLLTIVPSSNPATASAPVTYTVSATGVSGFSPTGTVTVSDGKHSCTISSFSVSGNCSINERAGTFLVSADYSGDSNYKEATATVSEKVKKAKSTVTLTPSANPAPKRESITYKVKVNGGTIAPTGTVTVSDGRGGSCSITLSAGAGSCAITEGVGNYEVTATYAGNKSYDPSAATVIEKVQ
jgi:large repetitive protein